MSLFRPVRQPLPLIPLQRLCFGWNPRSRSRVLNMGIAARRWGAMGACCPVFCCSSEQSGCGLRVSITHTQVPAMCSPNGHRPVPEGLQPKSQLSLDTSARSWIRRQGRVWSPLPAGSRGQDPAEAAAAFLGGLSELVGRGVQLRVLGVWVSVPCLLVLSAPTLPGSSTHWGGPGTRRQPWAIMLTGA